MIYYFSGTGNSRFVAQQLVPLVHDTAANINEAIDKEGETLGLVFPVYSWGLPMAMEAFIRNTLPSLIHDNTYIYCVMTCGDDMGYADKVLDKLLKTYCHCSLSAAFSVHMPNTYVCLPGFDVDRPEIALRKVDETRALLPKIATAIRGRQHTKMLHRGAFPWLKTYAIRPLFNRFLVTDRYLCAIPDWCTRCKQCVRHCPLHNISMTDNSPKWHGHCTGCLACYHVCPNHAIHFGKQTKEKGQHKQFLN